MSQYFIQLSLFPETEAQRNAREIAELRAHCNRLRRSLYARNGELAKAYSEIKHELDTLKAALCRYEKVTQDQGAFL